MKNKLGKIIIILGLVFFTAAGVYFYWYRSLSVEANRIFAIRCTNVNPPLIKYKNAYISMINGLKSGGSSELIRGSFEDYFRWMRVYLEEENKWLEIQKKFIDRWDYQLFMPEMKKAGGYQYAMYEASRDVAKCLITVKDDGKYATSSSKLLPIAKIKMAENKQLYDEEKDRLAETLGQNWRWIIFGQVPLPAVCTKDNLIIPNTSGLLDEPLPTSTPENFVPELSG